MKGKIFVVGTWALLLGVAVLASDVWRDKPYQSWDEKDVQKILMNSPWSQEIEVTQPADAAMGNNPSSGATDKAVQPDQSASGGKGMGMITHGDSNDGGGTTQMGDGAPQSGGGQEIYIARWFSSRTIREATARREELKGQSAEEAGKVLAETPGMYQVLLISRDLRPFLAAGEEALKSSMYLETKKTHEKIMPTKIDLVKSTDGKNVVVVVAEFQKQAANGEATLASDEKGADFVADAGKLKLKFHFDFSKMQDKQGLDL
jgi:hypothetical protein